MMDSLQACDIRIDKEGTWSYRGAEMFRREIVNFFYENLKQEPSGRFLIELPGDPGDRCYVDVEDTAFVVRAVYEKRSANILPESFMITLSDDTVEALDPATLRIGEANVLYCSVKGGIFSARFSRAGYYQLADHIEYDADNDVFYLTVNDRRFDIQQQPTVTVA